MRLRAKRGPIPLPDAEVISSGITVRAMSAIEQIADCPDFFRARVMRWSTDANAAGYDLLAIGWPDKQHCFAIVPCTASGAPTALSRAGMLAAYHHALRDPHARVLFAPLAEHLEWREK